MARWLGLVRAAILLVLIGMAVSVGAQEFTTFDLPNSTATLPAAINLKGQVVGWYVSATPDPHFGNGTRAFVRERDGSTSVIDASAAWGVQSARTFATAINLGGRITGYAVDPACLDCSVGFLRETDGTVTIFRAPFVQQQSAVSPLFQVPNYVRGTTATDINAFGQIVGVRAEPPGYKGFLRQRDGTFLDFDVPSPVPPTSSFFQTLPQAINDFGVITGYTNAHGPTYHGFLRKANGTLITFDAANSTGTYAQAINDLGEIAGTFTDQAGNSHGFFRRIDGKIIAFDPQGSLATQANAINVLGQIVGSYLGQDGLFHSFIRERNGQISKIDVPRNGVSGTYARDINAFGQVTGYYVDATGTHGFVMNPHRSWSQ